MRLTLFTDYAFRLLIHAAVVAPELVTISSTANSYGISRNHLTKIANELVRGGFLEAVRGRSGGLRLSREAKDISVVEVFRFCESSSPLVECFNPKTNQCVITPFCSLSHILYAAEQAFQNELAKHTLADLSNHREKLAQILA
jgi:Rrf2 family transcriptional regulator, nitric oxide-sensitive transcriptional repressor